MKQKQLSFEILLVSTWFLGVMAVKFMLPLLPLIAEKMQASTTLVKYTISIFLLGKASGMLVFGPLSEKYGRKLFMLIGLCVFTIGNLLAFAAPNIYFLLFARLIQGLGVSATVLIGRAMINDSYKHNKAAVIFSHVFLAASLIIACLPMIGSFIAMNVFWRFTFIIIASYSLIIYILCFFFLKETHHPKPDETLTVAKAILYYKSIISHPVFLGYVLCSIFMIAGESAFNTASSFLLMKTFNLTIQSFGLLMTTLAIGHFIGTFLCGKLVKKYHLKSMMGTGVTILALSSIAMALANNLGWSNIPTIIIPMIIFHLGTGFIMTITAVGAVTPFPHLIGISSAASLLLNFTFSALSSAVMSNLSTGTAGPLSLLLACYSICALLAWYKLIVPHDQSQKEIVAETLVRSS